MGDPPDDGIEAAAGENTGRSTPEGEQLGMWAVPLGLCSPHPIFSVRRYRVWCHNQGFEGALPPTVSEKERPTIDFDYQDYSEVQNFKIKVDLGLLSTSATLTRLFDKISLQSKNHQKEMPKRFTIPNPFHLLTEDRGIEKEKHFSEKILQKHLEEQRALIPKANPYPYSTDYPEIPYKPEPKECTQPKLFKLESLVRHEESMQRIAEEVQQIKKLESQRRNFKAQSMRDFGVIRLPERQKKPLTEIQEFSHHVDHRAVDREEFDKKIKEKEMTYKRLREKFETEKMIEEEEAVKKMRRTMVHHARPLPKFDNPFVPQTSTREATKALSPDLLVRRRGERCHAYHMR